MSIKTDEIKFSKLCNVKYMGRLKSNQYHSTSFDYAKILSDEYLFINDKINAICVLRGWGLNNFYNSNIMINFTIHINKQINIKTEDMLNTPYKHKIYYLGKTKKEVLNDLFLSILCYGNEYTNKYVITNDTKIPITKAMYTALQIMINVVKA